jgi:hypothetical protein
MRGFSLRTILIANAAAFAIALLIFAFGLGITIFAGIAVALFEGGDRAGLGFAAIVIAVTALISAPLGAGYVAGRGEIAFSSAARLQRSPGHCCCCFRRILPWVRRSRRLNCRRS